MSKVILAQLRPAMLILGLLTLLTGLAYPLAITGLAQLIFPHQANGSLIVQDGRLVGSELIGQPFTDPKYFWGRLSATSGNAYNSALSGGSNLGPTNPALEEAVRARIEALHATDPSNKALIPVDLVTASASGLDPHISIAAAIYQARRVEDARGLSEDQVLNLIARHTQGRTFGFLGEPVVNVLLLNQELDMVK
jgi:K+-transporting ATPase ATPase C chain